MSASKQKKVRSGQLGEYVDKKLAAQQESDKKNKRFKRNAIIAAVIVVIVLALSILINSTFFYTGTAAVQIGDNTYTVAEYTYYYKNAYSSFVSSYSSYISLFLDTSEPLDEQSCSFLEDEDATWADYFQQSAEADLIRVDALYNEAVAAGYTLPDEYVTEIEEDISSVETYASTYGYTTDAYLALTYCKGMDVDYYRQIVTKYYTAITYGESVYDSFTYTDEELEEHYLEIADEYDRISYQLYLCSTSLDEYSDMTDDEKTEAAHAAAEGIATATTAEEFSDKVYELLDEDTQASYTGTDYTFYKSYGQNLSSDYSEWLLDSSRQEGDTYVCDTDSGSYAIMYIDRDDNDYNTANVRHILITAEADDDGEYTDEALETAKAAIEEIQAQWEENPTEEYFAELAEANSEDTGSNTNGGLYETIYKGEMVDEFDAFCFDESRQPGDTGIVYGSSSSYSGYHFIYYVGEGQNYRAYLSESDLRSSDYDAYETSLTDGVEVTYKFAFRFMDLS